MRQEVKDDLALASAELAGGDFGGARRRLLALRARLAGDSGADAEEKTAVEAGLGRLRPDKVATALLVICLLLFTSVVWVTQAR